MILPEVCLYQKIFKSRHENREFSRLRRKLGLKLIFIVQNAVSKLPGGIQTGEKYSQSAEFQNDLKELKEKLFLRNL